MSAVIPEKYADLFEKQAFGNLSTLMKDGSPQVTPVWVDFDGKHVRVNSAKGRVKDKNVRRDPAWPSRYRIPRIPTATSKSADASWKSRKKARTTISISSHKNILGSRSTRSGSPAKFASCTKSSRKKLAPWARLIAKWDRKIPGVNGVSRSEEHTSELQSR